MEKVYRLCHVRDKDFIGEEYIHTNTDVIKSMIYSYLIEEMYKEYLTDEDNRKFILKLPKMTALNLLRNDWKLEELLSYFDLEIKEVN